MNPRKLIVWAVASLMLLNVSGTGCSAIKKLTGQSQPKQSQSQNKQKSKIGVVLMPGAENQAQIKKGLQDAAKKEGAQLVFLEGKDTKQLQQQTKDIKALILQGGSQASSIDLAKEDSKQKVPIIAIDQVPDTKVEAVVMPDYYHIGELQANYLKNALKQGNIVLLQSAQPGAEEVVAGIRTVLAQTQLKIMQTFTSPTKNASPTAAFDAYLKANPGKVQAVVCTDSSLALEAIEVLKKYNLSKKVQVVGAGTDKQAVDKIASGELNADVDKSPYLQGMYAYKLASQLSKQQTTDADKTVITQAGETPAKLVPVQLVRAENLAQFQKIYAQPTSAEGETDGQQTEQSGQGQGGDSQGGAAQGADQSGSAQSSAQQSGSKASKAAGVAKVREKIRTETTREMLDKDGKVIGTENQVHEEVRTLPQALLEATQKQAKQQGGDKGTSQDQKGNKQSDQSGDSGTSNEGQ